MKLYRIRNWSDLFENNRTRELKHMAWVPVPNRHDGDGYTTLVSRKNGAAIYGAWMVILQVASRCDPRGTLLRAPQKPHDAASIARITRLPEADIQAALDACTTETQWLEVEDIPTIPQEGAVKPQEDAPIPQGGAQEGNGKNGTELNGISTLSGKPDGAAIKKPRGLHPDTESVLDYLNQRAGRKFRRVPPNLSIISMRLSEPDVTLDGVKAMIDRQVTRWSGTTQAEYLRPETLFNRTKFDSYYASKDEPVILNDEKGRPQISAVDRIMKGLI